MVPWPISFFLPFPSHDAKWCNAHAKFFLWTPGKRNLFVFLYANSSTSTLDLLLKSKPTFKKATTAGTCGIQERDLFVWRWQLTFDKKERWSSLWEFPKLDKKSGRYMTRGGDDWVLWVDSACLGPVWQRKIILKIWQLLDFQEKLAAKLWVPQWDSCHVLIISRFADNENAGGIQNIRN